MGASSLAASVPVRAEVRIAAPTFEGGAAEAMACADRECCLDGPAGTGKTFAALWKMHLRRILFPGSRGLLARKTLVSLKSSTLVTYKKRVLGPLIDSGAVRFWASKGDEPAHYAYWNGSEEVIVGLDNPGKAMSTEYDDILVDEALDTEEGDIEALLTRIQRPGHVFGQPGRPPFAQLLLVTNPGAPHHWLNQRMLGGRTTRLLSRHEDNPAMTADYLAMLDHNLTGARRARLYLGLWQSAEGTVYEDAWDPARNHLPRSRYSTRPESLWGDCGIDRDWPRYLAIDWGFRAALSVQWYAKLPDGELVLYREIYITNRTVEKVAKDALAYMGWRLDKETRALLPTRPDADPLPREIVADVGPEYCATWEEHFGMSVYPATKGKDSITDGIQAMRLRLQDGRLIVLQHSLVERDLLLDREKKPQGFAEEIDAYVWDTRAGRPARELPIDDNDHAMDAARYLVQYFDRGEPDARRIAFSAVGY